MNYGYMGQLLRVDLTRRAIDRQILSEDLLRKYIGGSGLGARLLYDETEAKTDPFGADNLLLFLTGPLTGTPFPSSSRYAVIAKSALGIYGEGDIGGSWAVALKQAGYDGIAVQGKADAPLYLAVNDGTAELRDAARLWGRDTYETDAALKVEHGKKVQILSIGPGAEKGVKYAIIVCEGKHARSGGRGGLGAVMGAKQLKAIVVGGSRKVQLAQPEAFKALCREIIPGIREGTKNYTDLGTAGGLAPGSKFGVTPHKNWAWGSWNEEKVNRISGPVMKQTMVRKNYFCRGCVIGCGKSIYVADGPYAGVDGAAPEYETLGSLGTLCLVDDLAAIAKGNQLCNRYGIDTISTGGAIAFAMEAYERGIIGDSDTDGVKLTWGNAGAMLQMIDNIGQRKGFGRLLGEGVKAAAQALGKAALEFAVEVKGLEPPMHDPRSRGSMGIAFATDPRGASHSAKTYFIEKFPFPEFGYEKPLNRQQDEGKGIATAIMQDYAGLFNSLKICHFLMPVVKAADVVKCLNLATGWDMTLDEFLLAGERISNLQRLYNVRLGMTRGHDTLPPRIATLKFTEGGGANYLPDLNKMLDEYYAHRQWSADGIPLAAKLEQLSLTTDAEFLKTQFAWLLQG